MPFFRIPFHDHGNTIGTFSCHFYFLYIQCLHTFFSSPFCSSQAVVRAMDAVTDFVDDRIEKYFVCGASKASTIAPSIIGRLSHVSYIFFAMTDQT